jgi:hypothetical protein
MAGLDSIRRWPNVQRQAALPPLDYRGANKVLRTVRLALPASASAASPRKRQRVSQLAARPASVQRLLRRGKPSDSPIQAAQQSAALPADPVMSAHAASVHLFDLRGFRCAIARDVHERIRTASVRPLPTILPPRPRQAARPAPSSPSVGADSTAQQDAQSSAVTAKPPRHAQQVQHDAVQRQASLSVSNEKQHVCLAHFTMMPCLMSRAWCLRTHVNGPRSCSVRPHIHVSISAARLPCRPSLR